MFTRVLLFSTLIIGLYSYNSRQSSVRKKINFEFVWECTHRYCFSDDSQSSYSEITYHASTCIITCTPFD